MVDALASGASARKGMEVRVLFSAQKRASLVKTRVAKTLQVFVCPRQMHFSVKYFIFLIWQRGDIFLLVVPLMHYARAQ